MGRRRKDAPPAPETQTIVIRVPATMLRIVGALADKKQQSRNAVIVGILAKATKRYMKSDEVQG
jgi:hypothetical protein